MAVVCIFALAATGLLSCGKSQSRPARPNVLLITLDTVRADHCSAYGYERATTPTLEKMAKAGVLFEKAYAPMPTTGPAHATLFTSLPPLAHGVVKNGYRLRPEFVTLAEILSDHGYQTGAVVSSFAVHGKFGYRQGFTDYEDDFGSAPADSKPLHWEGQVITGKFEQDATVTTDEAAEWLRRRPGAGKPEYPFFLWVHYYDAHTPYEPPPHWCERLDVEALSDPLQEQIANHDAEILEVDDAIGKLLMVLDEMKLDDSTLVVVVGDHGEGLMQHGWMEHGLQIYEEAVRVPMVLRWPQHLPKSLRLEGPVAIADLMPTILDLAGVSAVERPTQGNSLVAAMREQAPLAADRKIYLQRRHYGPQLRYSKNQQNKVFMVKGDKFAVIAGRFKYLEALNEASFELYDLVRDPGETKNLMELYPDDAKRLAVVLERWKRAVAVANPEQTISPQDDQRLRTLGYTQ